MDDSWIAALRRINLNQLVVFSAVAQQSSYRGAAARLHLSQSALSTQVQQLEAALGVTLLYRDTRTVRLSQEGERLLEAFQMSGRELARVVSNLRDEGRLARGAVSVAVLPSLGSTFLTTAIVDFQKRYPAVSVQMLDVDSRRAHEQVVQGAVDIAVTSRGADDVEFVPLFKEDLLAIIPAGDRFFSKLKAVTPAQLATRPMLLNPRGVDLRERVEEIFRQAGVELKAFRELTSTGLLVALTSLEAGICVQPRSALYGLDLGACRVLPFSPGQLREIGAILPPKRTPSPATSAFLSALKAAAENASAVVQPARPPAFVKAVRQRRQ
ncbi:LysR family transcriptional regulator [Bordetella sp. N]|uniref:LysR family transcriptional regulator n=1 Tax=Bordetella sp. N TaxID=1746199 RepID=UPI00070D3291|nr:LysR family transcriptional regulator [Bordetella sp. N]ALM82216.1 LysR family transcriptional regulator [Bordetella sp. N]